MELAIVNRFFNSGLTNRKPQMTAEKNLTHAQVNQSYVIKSVAAEEKGMKEFLLSLGCFAGEEITVISVLAENYIITVKDARYSIDLDLAKAIQI